MIVAHRRVAEVAEKDTEKQQLNPKRFLSELLLSLRSQRLCGGAPVSRTEVM